MAGCLAESLSKAKPRVSFQSELWSSRTAPRPHLIVNETIHFDTGLTSEEMALLWSSVFGVNSPSKNFGVISQTEAIGIEQDSIVASTMMSADNWLGSVVYGYDSQFRLPNLDVPSYRNPFVADADFPNAATQP